MKIRTIAVYAFMLTIIPMYPMLRESGVSGDGAENIASSAAEQLPVREEISTSLPEAQTEEEPKCFLVLDAESKKVMTLSERDYVIGAIAAEMPALFEAEALKAQAVAAYTYAVRERAQSQRTSPEELCGAHFSNDSTKYQAFYTLGQMQERWGEKFDEYYEKIAAAADAVSGQTLLYGGEPIVAAFHSMSSGKTESSENVWGGELPYLRAVESEWDKDAPSYRCVYRFTAKDITETVTGCAFSGDEKSWLEVLKVSASGTVLEVRTGEKKISGTELRAMLGLRSAAFTCEYSDGVFVITTCGYGHGVGLSQYGANYMAKSGKTYKEILTHYYPQTELGVI